MSITPDTADIRLDLIVPPNPLLRTVRENTVQFAEMTDQIRRDGHILNAILVRPLNDKYQVCDGNRRHIASLRAGVRTIFAIVREMDDTEYLAKQIEANAGHEDTDWVEYARHLERLRVMNGEEMSLDDLAAIAGKHSKWISSVLRLNHLIKPAKDAVRRGEMTVGNAKLLAKLPMVEQPKLFTDAITMPVSRFRPVATDVLSRYREAVRQGRLDALGTDAMKPRMRNFDQIKAEIGSPSVVPLILVSKQITNPVEIVQMALQWAFRLDPESVLDRKQKLLRQEQQRIDDAKKRQEDREILKISQNS